MRLFRSSFSKTLLASTDQLICDILTKAVAGTKKIGANEDKAAALLNAVSSDYRGDGTSPADLAQFNDPLNSLAEATGMADFLRQVAAMMEDAEQHLDTREVIELSLPNFLYTKLTVSFTKQADASFAVKWEGLAAVGIVDAKTQHRYLHERSGGFGINNYSQDHHLEYSARGVTVAEQADIQQELVRCHELGPGRRTFSR